jgi:predicted lipoprotein with Yx(FWY)xxD motif
MRKALLILPIALLLAGCGAGAGQNASAPADAAAKHAVVKTRHTDLGTFLVDARGRTLYLFKKDTGRRSRCSGACAVEWPPLITREKPEAEGSAKASLLSTTRRRNGSKQVLYNGHPLYRYAPDSVGETFGQGLSAFGARWYVVSPSGRAIVSSGSSSAPPPSGYTY